MGYATGKIQDYLADAASNKPAPGGGSVSALAAALASSMSEMAANFTVGKKKFAGVDSEVRQHLAQLEKCRARLMQLLDADVEAYGGVGAAYSMPKDTDAQKAAREEAIQKALTSAMGVPLDIMRQCRLISESAAKLVEIANPNLITDVGVSAILSEAACAGARLNVEVNLKYISDQTLVASTRPLLDEMSQVTARCRESVSRAVSRHLSG
jgi:formiminotetrahydrofolate cyclodeaminase